MEGNKYSFAIHGIKFFSIFCCQKIEEINLNRLTKLIIFTLGKKIAIVLSKNQQKFSGKKNIASWKWLLILLFIKK
jgi:HD superfamily phosphohydrolase YqeK